VRRLLSLAALSALALAAPARASGTPRMFVLAFKAPPTLAFTGKRLAQAVATEAAKLGTFEVLGPDAVEERVGRRAYQRLVECAGEARCIADADVPLSAERVVGGRLEELESSYEVRVSQVDLGSGRALATFARVVPIGSRQLVAEVVSASGPLLRGEAEGMGELVVSASTPRAEVYVDGRSAGYTPLSMRLKPGSYQVGLEKPGYVKPAPQKVEVSDGDVATVSVALTPLPPGEVERR